MLDCIFRLAHKFWSVFLVAAYISTVHFCVVADQTTHSFSACSYCWIFKSGFLYLDQTCIDGYIFPWSVYLLLYLADFCFYWFWSQNALHLQFDLDLPNRKALPFSFRASNLSSHSFGFGHWQRCQFHQFPSDCSH